MKKIIILITCILLLAGCSNTTENNNIDIEETSESLKNPILEWCQLYNPNGYNTITCVISNPNNVDIDISYDLVYYKDGKEVSRTDEQWSNYQISPNHNDVIWGNSDIPSSNDVDEVKMENITVNKAYYNSINAEVKYTETVGDKAYFSVKSDKVPVLNNIWIFEYNDDNNNKKCDKGELVVVVTKNTTEQETKLSIDNDVYKHDSYETYYNAY